MIHVLKLKHCKLLMDYPINTSWVESPGILFTQSKLKEFVPSKDMSYMEKINAITRFIWYSSIILFIVKRDTTMFLIPIISMVVIYFLIKWGSDIKELNEHFHLKEELILKKNPTINNPFMNQLPGEHNEITEAKNDSFSTRKEIDKNFNFNLYKNTNDVFGRENSGRQFYTTPNTSNPNKQKEFATWLYGSDATCKESNNACKIKTRW